MEHSPEPRETTSRFEKLLAALVTDRADFAVGGGLAVILSRQGSRRENDKLDMLALREILAREAGRDERQLELSGGCG